MSNHTPGPWRQDGEVVREQDTNDVIAEPGNNFGCINPSQVLRANAALIAAAPETRAKLDELLETAEGVVDDLRHYVSTHGPGPDKRLDAFRAAIAKARGVQS